MRKLEIFFILLLFPMTIAMNTQSNYQIEAKETEITKQETTKNQQEHGKASYYGSNYRTNRKTASGKPYDKKKLTAAHKTLPFGTIVRVTNKKNGKTVDVEINDRGPFIKGRVIDLSVAAAQELDMMDSGIIHVSIDIIEVPGEKQENC